MKRLTIETTSWLNIALHFISAAGLGWFDWEIFVTKQADSEGVVIARIFGALLGAMVVVITVDLVACLRARWKEPHE